MNSQSGLQQKLLKMNASSQEWTNSQQGYERLPTSEGNIRRYHILEKLIL